MGYPGTYNISITQGETVSRTLTWAIDSQPVNLTGYSARMQVRERVSSERILLELTTGAGLTLGAEAGTVTISITDTVTAALTPAGCVYSLELTSPDGEVTPLLSGSFSVRAEVTR